MPGIARQTVRGKPVEMGRHVPRSAGADREWDKKSARQERFLASPPVRGSYNQPRRVASAARPGLRKAPDLAALPWHFLCNKEAETPVDDTEGEEHVSGGIVPRRRARQRGGRQAAG